MKVCEIFASIQGESTYAGMPCTFIRLTGCNLRCSYCDTAYAYDNGTEFTEDELVHKVRGFGMNTVEITGGEPLLQKGVLSLVRKLLDNSHAVLIETNGSKDISRLDRRAVIIMDVKTPGSGMSGKIKLSNFKHLKPEDEIKFVLTNRDDYVWAKEFIREHGLIGRCGILFSPVFGTLEPADLSRWIIEDRLEVRLNLQLHKHIYGPETRGV